MPFIEDERVLCFPEGRRRRSPAQVAAFQCLTEAGACTALAPPLRGPHALLS